MEDDFKKIMENNLKRNKTKMEDDLNKKLKQLRRPQHKKNLFSIPLNLRANLSVVGSFLSDFYSIFVKQKLHNFVEISIFENGACGYF